MFENLALRGLLSVIGAFFISLSVGVAYLWGIITIYATSYFRIVMKDDTLTEQLTDIVFPLTLLGQAISMPFVTRYARKVSSGSTCFVSGIIMSSLMYLSSLTTDYKTFALLFGLGNGIIIGVIYILPIGHCYQFFPRRKTLISILIISANGIGTLIFATIAVDCMNFDNLSLEEGGYNLYYGQEIAGKFPEYLRILSGFTLGFVSGGGLLLFQYPVRLQNDLKKQLLEVHDSKDNLAGLMDLEFVLQGDQSQQTHKNPFGNTNYELKDVQKGFDHRTNLVGKVYGQRGHGTFWPALEQSQNQYQMPKTTQEQCVEQTPNEVFSDQLQNLGECPRTSDGPRECIFWMIFIIIVLGSNFGLMVSVNYKTYYKTAIFDDSYLTMIGGLGAVACGLSRFFWGSILQKSTFKFLYMSLSIINFFLALTITYVVPVKQIYFAYVIFAYICYGGILGMFPAITSQIFGIRYGPQIYGILFYAFPISNVIQYFLSNYLKEGYYASFVISGAMSIFSMLLVKRIELKYDWSERIRQNNERKRMMAR